MDPGVGNSTSVERALGQGKGQVLELALPAVFPPAPLSRATSPSVTSGGTRSSRREILDLTFYGLMRGVRPCIVTKMSVERMDHAIFPISAAFLD